MQKMISGQSTPQTSERWGVTIGKETFFLDEKQIKVLKEAMLKGSRGAVWFKDFAISIPHVQCVFLVERRPKPLGIERAITETTSMSLIEKERALQKLKEIRKSLKERKIIN